MKKATRTTLLLLQVGLSLAQEESPHDDASSTEKALISSIQKLSTERVLLPSIDKLQLTPNEYSIEGLQQACGSNLNKTCAEALGHNFRAVDFSWDLKAHFTPEDWDAFLGQNHVPISEESNLLIANKGHDKDSAHTAMGDHYYLIKRVGGDSAFVKIFPDDVWGSTWLHSYNKGSGPVLCIEMDPLEELQKQVDDLQKQLDTHTAGCSGSGSGGSSTNHATQTVTTVTTTHTITTGTHTGTTETPPCNSTSTAAPINSPTEAPNSPTRAPTKSPSSSCDAKTIQGCCFRGCRNACEWVGKNHPPQLLQWVDDGREDCCEVEIAACPSGSEEEETEAPTEVDTSQGGGASGDPHIIDWAGNRYDFHGGCDLVLASVPGFAGGLGLDIHVRTKIHTWWSFVESLALRIGEDTLEIKGGILQKQEDNPFWFNGKRGQQSKSGKLKTKLGGFTVRYHFFALFARQFRVNLGDGDEITIRVYKDFVSIRTKVETPEKFGSAMGLMGTHPEGTKVARDGVTIMEEDTDVFGKEWQVLATEPKLFHNLEGPMAPEACAMPNMSQMEAARRRRLGESAMSQQQAEQACAAIQSAQDRESCIQDVLVTNDKGMVVAYL